MRSKRFYVFLILALVGLIVQFFVFCPTTLADDNESKYHWESDSFGGQVIVEPGEIKITQFLPLSLQDNEMSFSLSIYFQTEEYTNNITLIIRNETREVTQILTPFKTEDSNGYYKDTIWAITDGSNFWYPFDGYNSTIILKKDNGSNLSTFENISSTVVSKDWKMEIKSVNNHQLELTFTRVNEQYLFGSIIILLSLSIVLGLLFVYSCKNNALMKLQKLLYFWNITLIIPIVTGILLNFVFFTVPLISSLIFMLLALSVVSFSLSSWIYVLKE
jgi:hypothetical protein